MARYANQTRVAPERSRDEIERDLMRYGATGFLYGWDDEASGDRVATVMFRLPAGTMVRFRVTMPPRGDFERTEGGRARRSRDAVDAAWEGAQRQRWRALALVIKAKLEAVESGVSTVEDEFLAQTVLPDNSTVGSWIRPQIDAAYANGRMPALLPATGKGGK